MNVTPMPLCMFDNEQEIKNSELPDAFAKHFKAKVENLTNENNMNRNVYNGRKKIMANNFNFMNQQNVLEAISSIKLKIVKAMTIFPKES